VSVASPPRLSIVVVGGGVGGLAAAIRLAAAGHDVQLLERSAEVGGKLGRHRAGGFTWETGPSLLTLPAVFDELLGLAGTSLARSCRPVRLDVTCRYHFADGSSFATRDEPAATRAEVEALSPGSGPAWDRWQRRAGQVWSTAERTFFAGPIEDPVVLARRMRSPLDLLAIDPLPTLHQRAARTFADPRLVQWACRYATYAGSDPWRAPATLGCIPYVEQAHGCWALLGGLATLADALAAAATSLGASVRTDAEVTAILADGPGSRTSGVQLASGEVVASDLVVADVDAAHLYADLLPDAGGQRRVRAAGRSTSGFVLLLGAAGQTEALDHHTVLFSGDYRREFVDIAAGRPPSDPTVYVCAADRTDPAAAPPGAESLFVLVNVPSSDEPAAAWGQERTDAYAEKVLDVLDRRGLDLRRRLVHREVITPADLATRHRAVGGAIYGTSSNGRRAAFTRPSNRGRRPGLYLVGGSSHPGGGLPLVALSAKIAAAMIEADIGAGPARPGP
jgi:phytoene desaturase